MNRQDVEKTITQYLNPIFGFALKRCKSMVKVSIDAVSELIAAPHSKIDMDDNKETIQRLQTEIARELGILLGTVK